MITPAAEYEPREIPHPTRDRGAAERIWVRLRDDRAGMTGLVIVGLFLALAVAVSLGLAGQGWSAADGGRWEPAGSEHWFGTNVLGQDIFQRAIYSVQTAFEIGVAVALLSTALGALLGALSGWYSHGWADAAVLWLEGVLDSIPFYLFVAAVAYALQGQAWAMHVAMIATFWTTTGRLVRAEVMKLKNREFVLAARSIGLPVPLVLARLCRRDQDRGHPQLPRAGRARRRQLGTDAGGKHPGGTRRALQQFPGGVADAVCAADGLQPAGRRHAGRPRPAPGHAMSAT
jgi:ABC-type antimicrobial peptide transport system permease subunit